MVQTIGRDPLRDRVLQYQRTGRGREELVREITERAYRFPRRSMGWDEDACGDFLLYVYPRLAGLLDRFQDLGRPFEPYLISMLAWNLKSFARRKAEARACGGADLRIVGIDKAAEEGTQDPPDPHGAPSPVDRPSMDPDAVRRTLQRLPRNGRKHFLFLLLKCMRSLDPDDLRVLAAAAGVGPGELARILDGLAARLARKESRLEMLRVRRNRAYSLARCLEVRIASEPDERRRESLRVRLEAANRCMRNAMGRMARVGTAPSNREIAEVLGVPKGTVDSGLFWVKRRLSARRDPGTSLPA